MTYRIAVVGAGDWARRHHLPALAGDARAEIAVIVDADADRRAQAGAQFSAPTASSLDEALTGAQLDGVVVATPHSTHAPLVTAALNAGLAVLVEKPLTLTSAEAIEIVRRVRETGALLMVGYTAQYTQAASAVREWVTGSIGELRQVIVEFSSRAGALYARTAPDDARSAYSAASGGGQATTQLTHAFAAICYATGRSFTDVSAFTAERGGPVDVDDVVAFRLEGGVTGAAASTGTLPPELPIRHVVRYIGSDGIVEHDLLMSTARLDEAGGSSRQVSPPHSEAPYPAGAPVRAFLGMLDAAADGDAPTDMVSRSALNPAPVWPAAAAVAGIEAVLRSADSGRRERAVSVPH